MRNWCQRRCTQTYELGSGHHKCYHRSVIERCGDPFNEVYDNRFSESERVSWETINRTSNSQQSQSKIVCHLYILHSPYTIRRERDPKSTKQ